MTRLSLLHVHYFSLGLVFFLLLAALEKLFISGIAGIGHTLLGASMVFLLFRVRKAL